MSSVTAPRLTVITSPPRCGSMWVYNAFRRIYAGQGLVVKPDALAFEQTAFDAVVAAARGERDPNVVYTVKTHRIAAGPSPGMIATTVFRDPRDMAVSLNDFAGDGGLPCPYIDAVAEIISFYERIESVGGDSLLRLRYADIVDAPAAVVGTIRAAVDFPTDAADDAAIADALSPSAVRQVIASAERDETNRAALQRHGVLNRAMDPATGFQTGHISDRATDKWRARLPADEIAQINARFGAWLTAHGFAVDDMPPP